MRALSFVDRLWQLWRSRHNRAMLLFAGVAALSLVAATAEFVVLTKREAQLVDRFSDSTWWMAAQFRGEIFKMHISLASYDGTPESMDDLRQRMDILYARIGVMRESTMDPRPGPEMAEAIEEVVQGTLALGQQVDAPEPLTPARARALSDQMPDLERAAGRMTTIGAQADAEHREGVRQAIWRANVAFGFAAVLLVGSLLLSLRAVDRQATKLDAARRRSEALSRDLSVALAQAEAGARAKSVFLATMSHEVRTPMNGVLGAASLLSHTPLADDQRRWVEIVKACGEALLAQLDGVLDFSALEAAEMPLQLAEFDPRALLESTARVVEGAANQQRLDLVVAVDPDVPAMVQSDPRRLGQVLLNLVTNAVKFTSSGGVLLRLSLRWRRGRAWLRFAVVDSGPGIPRADRRRIFQEFTRLNRDEERIVRGTGLGLAISLRIVSALGGAIRVGATQGGGSLFLASIPVGVPEAAAPADAAPATPALPEALSVRRTAAVAGAAAPIRAGLARLLAAEGYTLVAPTPSTTVDLLLRHVGAPPADIAARRLLEFGPGAKLDAPITALRLHAALTGAAPRRPVAPPPRAAGRALSLLVADDDPINCEIAANLLRYLGHRVTTVTDGMQALEAARQANQSGQPFDCALLDLYMPRMDGTDLARAIRALPPPGGRMRLIAVTADADAGIAGRAKSAGIDAVVTKPVTLELLHAALRPLAGDADADAPGAGAALAGPVRAALAAQLPPERLAALIGLFWTGVAESLERPGGLLGEDFERRLHTLSGSSAGLGYAGVPPAARRARDAARHAAEGRAGQRMADDSGSDASGPDPSAADHSAASRSVAVADALDMLYDALAAAARADAAALAPALAERLEAGLAAARLMADRAAVDQVGGMA